MRKLLILILILTTLSSPAHASSACDIPISKVSKEKFKVLFVNFSDYPETDISGVYRALDPIKDYYAYNSYNKAKIILDVHPSWINMPNTAISYNINGGNANAFVQDVVSRVDAKIDFSKYKGVIVISNPMAIEVDLNIATNVSADGKALSGFFMGADLFSGGLNSWFVAAHELGHSFGLVDLYNHFTQDFNFIYDLSIMSNAGHGTGFLGYERLKMGWIGSKEYKCISDDTSIKLSNLNASKGLKLGVIKLSDSSYLFIESRNRKGVDYMLSSPGIIVYTLDTNIPNGSGPIRLVGVVEKNSSISYKHITISNKNKIDISIN